jgi:Baseplate J-like protein
MTLRAGKIYIPANAAEVRDDLLADMRLEARKWADEDEVDRLSRPGTDWHLLATGMGNIGLLQYANIEIHDSDSDVITATGEHLDRIRENLGLPEIPPSPATGAIVVGPIHAPTVLSNHEFVLPNGKRARVDGTFVGLQGSPEVAIVTIDTGSDVNLATGETVKFVAPPSGVPVEATVSASAPFSGGTDFEDDERKRERILNRLRNPPAGGNVGHVREIALNALPSLQTAFVYPALGGPGSAKVVLVRAIDPPNDSFGRTFADSATNIVRSALHAELPSPMEIVVQTGAEENVDIAMTMTLPAAVTAGGDGTGWLDDTPWPPLSAQTRVTISATTSGTFITVDAATTTAPIAGQTRIAWWSIRDRKFHVRLVTGVSGSAGAWALTLDSALTDIDNNTAAIGDYISAPATSTEAYGDTFLGATGGLGPGENTSDSFRLPRARRHPFTNEEWPSDLTVRQLKAMLDVHPEITDAAWSYRSATSPTTPGAAATAPNVFVLRHFGIYPT